MLPLSHPCTLSPPTQRMGGLSSSCVRSERVQEGDEVLLLFVGEIHLEALVVEVDELLQVGGSAVVEVGSACGEAAKDGALAAIDIRAEAGDETFAGV